MKFPRPSTLDVVRFIAFLIAVLSLLFLERPGIVFFLALLVFFVCSFLATRQALKSFDIRGGLRRLRDDMLRK